MGVTQDKGRTKPRPLMASQRPTSSRATSEPSPISTLRTSQRPSSLRTTSESSPISTFRASQHPSSPSNISETSPTSMLRSTAASAATVVCRKEEEKLRGTSAQSSVKSMNIPNNNANKSKVVLAASQVNDDKKNENKTDKNDTEKLLIRVLPASQVKDDKKNENKNDTDKLLIRALYDKKNVNKTDKNDTEKSLIRVLPASEVKDDKKNENKNDKNDTDKLLIRALGDMSLSEDNDLNNKLKNLSIKENQNKKEPSEDSDLVSRGPDRICTKGTSRTAPYLHEQHILSSDKQGGGTVLYPNISTAYTAIGVSYNQNLHQGYTAASWQNPREENSSFTSVNDVTLNEYNSELEKLLYYSDELPHFNAEDVDDVLLSSKEDTNVTDPDINYIDKIIQSTTDDKDIQPIKQELWEGAMEKHRAPTTPVSADSDYESDECSVGSPSSVTSGASRSSGTSGISETSRISGTSCISGTSGVLTDREIGITMNTPYVQLVTQPTNLHTQTGFARVSNSPVIQTVQVPSGMFLVLPKQTTSQFLPQQQPQPLAPSSTPPPSPQGLRPILPGINIPSDCHKCSDPAIARIRCAMAEQIKERAWALMFADPDCKFTEVDDEGDMFLSCVLKNHKKIKYFMEVLYVLIKRLKAIINRNIEIASKLLATPNKNGCTPLDIACRLLQSSPQNALAVRYLAETMVEEGLPIAEEVDGNGNSLLHRLCLCGDEACYIMAELLSMKDKLGKSVFDVNKKNNEGKTPLHIAAQTHGDRISCAILAQLLIRSGADISMKEGCAGNTVFHLVARESCDPNLLLTLLANTSYASKVINEKNFNEDTPLHMVAANRAITPQYQRLAVQHMIEYGADPKLQNKSGKAPLSLVPTDRKQEIKNVLYHKRQVTCHE